jgi:hypothetical protein
VGKFHAVVKGGWKQGIKVSYKMLHCNIEMCAAKENNKPILFSAVFSLRAVKR